MRGRRPALQDIAHRLGSEAASALARRLAIEEHRNKHVRSLAWCGDRNRLRSIEVELHPCTAAAFEIDQPPQLPRIGWLNREADAKRYALSANERTIEERPPLGLAVAQRRSRQRARDRSVLPGGVAQPLQPAVRGSIPPPITLLANRLFPHSGSGGLQLRSSQG